MNQLTTLQNSDLETLLASHGGNRSFALALESVATGDDLLRVLGQYVQFNATFGGGVASLAGEIAVRQDLFRDPEETVPSLADRSMEIASDIFAAAIDEFDDSATAHRDTHRSLAQATIKATGGFFGKDDLALDSFLQPTTGTREATVKMRTGYGVNRILGNTDLLRAIGFHIGSEVLADKEFQILDGFLRSHFPELVTALEGATVKINGEQHAAYFWIRIHTSVEADHLARALEGANLALRYYSGDEGVTTARECIVEGIREFSVVQNAFMEQLVQP